MDFLVVVLLIGGEASLCELATLLVAAAEPITPTAVVARGSSQCPRIHQAPEYALRLLGSAPMASNKECRIARGASGYHSAERWWRPWPHRHHYMPAPSSASKSLLFRSLSRLFNVDDISLVPQVLCDLLNADKCVVWKPSRETAEAERDGRPRRSGRLYPYSSNFDRESAVQHAGISLEAKLDITGRFYSSGKPNTFDNNFRIKDRSSPSEPFMAQHHLQRVCLATFRLTGMADGTFVVALYRTKDQPLFRIGDAARLEEIATFLPRLYQQLVSPQLKEAVEIANHNLRKRFRKLDEAKGSLDEVCAALGRLFRAREVSVFLCERSENSNVFKLAGRTVALQRKEYRANEKDGLTGYILAKKCTVWFHDLYSFQDIGRRKLIEARYPGITWSDGAEFGRLAKEILGLPSSRQANPPLPFVGVPIFGEHEVVLGVIRASFGTNPFYFLGAQIQMFEIIAREIGRWWEASLDEATQFRRAEVWEALNKTVIKQHETLKSSDDTRKLIDETVRSIVQQHGFDLAAFRRGGGGNELRLLSLAMSEREAVRRVGARVPAIEELVPIRPSLLEAPDHRITFHVGRIDRTAEEILETGSEREQATFAGLSRVLSRPVFVGSTLYGVLDVGFQSEADYSSGKTRVDQFVDLIARQFALFVRMAESLAEAQAAKVNELRNYKVVTHQLRTPLLPAAKRLRLLGATAPENWTPDHKQFFAEVAGMVRKAHHVASLIEVFGKLVANEAIESTLSSAEPASAWTLVVEVTRNARILVDPRAQVSADVGKRDRWGVGTLIWDVRFAEQCIDAVVSNAFKYSAPKEKIEIDGFVRRGQFVISLVNHGPYIIAPRDVESTKKKDWRGKKARERDGAGLGLWIADELMKAQKGQLIVYPTTPALETKIELCFPFHVGKP